MTTSDEAQECPFHDLPPSEEVWLKAPNGPMMVRSAQRWCEEWHFARMVDTILMPQLIRLIQEGDLYSGPPTDRPAAPPAGAAGELRPVRPAAATPHYSLGWPPVLS